MITIATTTSYTSESLRSRLALEMVAAASSEGFRVVVVDANSYEGFTAGAEDAGATVHLQVNKGAGAARREALSHARDWSNDDFVVMMEPEKVTLVRHLVNLETRAGDAKMVLFWRRSLSSYSREQRLMYEYGRLLSEYLLNEQLDLFFGPVAVRGAAVQPFLDDEADRWGAVHLPRLDVIKKGIARRQIRIDYAHPAQQTAEEIGKLELFRKRTEQADVLTLSYVRRAHQLGLVSEPWVDEETMQET